MSDEVSISNLSLSHLGERASVSSLSPPEGSAFSPHCAAWLPIARRAMLEMHDWNFATRRAAGTLMTEVPLNGWLYAYAKPNKAVRVFAVLPAGADGDVRSSQLNRYNDAASYGYLGNYTSTTTAPREFVMETLSDGTEVIYTNEPNAVLRFTVDVIDYTKYTPLAELTLSHILASFLAGPILKGATGRTEAKAQLQMAMTYMARAATSDASQSMRTDRHEVSWITNR
jgi:hypothetical protein